MKRNLNQAVLVFLLSFSVSSGSWPSVSLADASDPGKDARRPQIWSAATGRHFQSADKSAHSKGRLHLAKDGLSRRSLSDLGDKQPEAAGEPLTLDTRSALSAAVFTAAGPGAPGLLSSFTTPTLLANNDGREDFTADRAQPVDTLGPFIRSAISEHTVANGFAENAFYEGDALGNLIIGVQQFPTGPHPTPAIDTFTTVNLPALLTIGSNAGFTIVNPLTLTPAPTTCASATIAVTGIAVNPVADLSDFGAACGTVGEVVYVSVLDTNGCGFNGSGELVRTRVLAFAFTDGAGANALTPVSNVFQVYSSTFSNAGIAVDDDGSLYIHQVDLQQFRGGAIYKATEVPHVAPAAAGCGAAPRINRVIQGLPTAPLLTQTTPINSPAARLTNFSSGTAGGQGVLTPAFGNIVALATGPHNVLYAALARSFVNSDDPATQASEGQFTNPASLGPTPSMIITFADVTGAKDACSTGDPATGTLPIGDGFADVAQVGQTLSPGVNNFRVFALGNGPDIRNPNSIIGATPGNTLKLDMQIDNSIYAGLMVDEEGTAYVISGGEPADTGTNPSPNRGEILAFPDRVPYDRRADYIDLRPDLLPNPPNSGGTGGDGDSDRFDHIYWQAPLDPATRTPGAVSGLARGFLRYTNRLAPNAISPGVTLGATQRVQADDESSTAPIFFDLLDPGHQVAGGDDQVFPFRGDDSGGAGNPALPAALNGGFEFTFGGNGAASIFNGFFLNSNGNITFNDGDASGAPTLAAFRTGLPRIAPAWTDLNPSARATDPRVFPIQALGFAADNAFKVRWINVPQKGSEICTANGSPGTGSNTFALTLYDDGTGKDENANQTLNPANPLGNNAVPFDLQEGPTDLRYIKDSITGFTVGSSPRPDGTGYFYNDYSRMDLIGSAAAPVITGYSEGGMPATNPPGLCETNVSEAARSADSALAVTQGLTAGINAGVIGEGTEPTIYELFNAGTNAVPEFDLRFEGNDPNTSPATQPDKDRTSVGFFGLGANAPPAVPVGIRWFADPFVTTPSTTGAVNAIGPVTLTILGSGFVPSETTTVCPSGGDSAARPGKTVSTTVTFSVDADQDGTPEVVIPLTNVTVINSNIIRATIPPASGLAGSPFPLTANGGFGFVTVTTSVSAGDNNVFGAFTRTSFNDVNSALGTRAPVVTSVAPTSGDCGASQTLALTGSSFQFNEFVIGSGVKPQPVSDVIATEVNNSSNVIHASSFSIVDNNHLNATFSFGGVNGRSFLIQAIGPGGPSRDMTVLPAGAPPPLGNEAGSLIQFSCGTGETVQFSAAQSSVAEDVVVAPLTITRSNPGAGTVTVDFNTLEGTANQKADYTTMFGTVTFAPGETSKVINIPITQDAYVEPDEYLQVTLSNSTGGASIGAQATELVFITNDDVAPSSLNPIDNPSIFVNQQYHDFLSRQADVSGLTFWTSGITSCLPVPLCSESLRVNTSAAFFLSIEFQETGFNVLRSQRVAFGKQSAVAATRYPYLPFLRDAQRVAAGVIIGQPGDFTQLEANKQAYANSIVTSTPFIAAYPAPLTASQYVDALYNTAAVLPTVSERNAAINAFGAGSTAGRVAAFRSIVDCPSLRSAESNPAFVLMEYYGYLRRNPTDAPDNNDDGYQFWLSKLNAFAGNFVAAEMVKAFLSSSEYRQRFNSP